MLKTFDAVAEFHPIEGRDEKKLRMVFDQWEDMLDFAENAPTPVRRQSQVSRQYDSFWTKADFPTALKFAREGWHDLENKVRDITSAVFEVIGSAVMRPLPNYDVEGEFIDVAKYAQGEPECWMHYDYEPTPAPGKLIRVMFNYSASAGITSGIEYKGAAIAAIIEILEFAGKSVELWCCDTSAYSRRRPGTYSGFGSTNWQKVGLYENFACLKHHGDPLDLGRMLYALAHPSMLRCLGFAVQERVSEHYLRTYFGWEGMGAISYGSPYPLQKKDWGDLYVDAGDYGDLSVNWGDKKSVLNWVFKQLQAQGVQFDEQLVAANK